MWEDMKHNVQWSGCVMIHAVQGNAGKKVRLELLTIKISHYRFINNSWYSRKNGLSKADLPCPKHCRP